MPTTGHMKTLSLLRHAKADRPEQYATDLARPLTDRGRKDAMRMAAVLTDLDPPVDFILSSPSLRTRQTVTAVLEILERDVPVHWDDRIYEAGVHDLLNGIAAAPTDCDHLLVVGHNPGMEELIAALCSGDNGRLVVIMPTAGLAHVTLNLNNWNKVSPSSGTLQWLLRPKLLRT